MKNKETVKYHNVFAIGNAFATLTVGFSARIVVYFEQLPNRPPRHAVALLLYFCDWAQRNNLYNDKESEIIGVEVSARELAKAIGANNPKTVYNGLKWLEKHNFVTIDKGSNQTAKTVVTVNVEEVNQIATSGNQDKPPNYDYQSQEWENVLKRLGKWKIGV